MRLRQWVSGLLACVMLAGLATGCSKAQAPSDTVKWINTTYAMLTAANGGDINEVGGYKKNSVNEAVVQAGLEQSWDVTDRASAEETLDWLLDEGHRATFAEEMSFLEESGFLEATDEEIVEALMDIDFTEEEAACYLDMVRVYADRGAHAIDAWDYCRALQLLGWYSVAGYYTEQEALDQSLEIAKTLQGLYGSWEELTQSYLDGYHYWSEDDASDPESPTAVRREVYEELVAGKDNPYGLDWNTELVKTWE